jgi:hypothetical protein
MTLLNDPTVNPVERQHCARHKSIQAQNAYICPTALSEMACMRSLNPTIPLPSNDSLEVPTESTGIPDIPSNEPGSLIAQHLQPTGTEATAPINDDNPIFDEFVLPEQFSDDDEEDQKPAYVEKGSFGGEIV